MTYTLDTNILINMERRYPREFFNSLWDSMEAAVVSGDICMCEVAQKELDLGDDDLSAWVKGIPGFVCKSTDEELATVADISGTHPDWVQGQKNYADPFVIAHAKADNEVIVTEEGRKGPNTEDKNQKIPNIADEHGVACIKFFDLLRAQGWKF
ncbi:DUF4411 family protein [Brevibacterium sp. 50QC2O2]|uniref:DUF4411 family protein n=1 Tax=unclassified Brevibacterium TaxID=2614124 RepID=UPI00211C306F|nr:DUF4411 family protein [Brevibacterium sp. 91QC2O2]MCQ9389053.1 DUF4411 family protein [Brevibacterium sp. 50QC2O2]